jgi:hypothetical protein
MSFLMHFLEQITSTLQVVITGEEVEPIPGLERKVAMD